MFASFVKYQHLHVPTYLGNLTAYNISTCTSLPACVCVFLIICLRDILCFPLLTLIVVIDLPRNLLLGPFFPTLWGGTNFFHSSHAVLKKSRTRVNRREGGIIGREERDLDYYGRWHGGRLVKGMWSSGSGGEGNEMDVFQKRGGGPWK